MMYKQNNNKYFIKSHYFVFKLVIILCICSGLLSACSNQTKDSNQQYMEQIQALNEQILKLEMQTPKICELEKQSQENEAIITNLQLQIEELNQELSIKNFRIEQLNAKLYSKSNESYLETLQWIQEIAFDDRNYPEILDDSEDKIIEKIINNNIIKVNDNEIILTYGISNQKNNTYDIECLVYEKANLVLESGGKIKSICFTVEKNNNKLKLLEEKQPSP